MTVGESAEKAAMGPFGSSIQGRDLCRGGCARYQRTTPWPGSSPVDGSSGFNYISEEHAQRLANGVEVVKRGDIVFTHAGNIGQAAYVPELTQSLSAT